MKLTPNRLGLMLIALVLVCTLASEASACGPARAAGRAVRRAGSGVVHVLRWALPPYGK